MVSAGTGEPNSADAQPERLVQLVTVDTERQRTPEIGVGEPFAKLGVRLVALVDLQQKIGAPKAQIEMDFVVALLLIFQNNRQLAEVDVPFLHVVLARHGTQVDDFQVLHQR